jgi:hypothetical protein
MFVGCQRKVHRPARARKDRRQYPMRGRYEQKIKEIDREPELAAALENARQVGLELELDALRDFGGIKFLNFSP